VLLPKATGGQGPEDRPPPIAPTTTPNPCSDLVFLEQLVKAVVAGMAVGMSNPAPQAETMVTLVKWVKGIWEMGCTTYSREEDAEVAGELVEKGRKGYRSYASVMRSKHQRIH
jgi:hypothetical protein